MRIVFIMLAVLMATDGYAQKESANKALVDEFTKVMSFGSNQYVSYSMLTRISSEPVLLHEDTATTKGVFYKNGNSMYSSNGLEDTYFQDSFYIQVNHARKTVWVNKATPKEFEKMMATPVSNTALKKITGENFSATKTVTDHQSKIVFESTKTADANTSIKAVISVLYNNETFLPSTMNMQITMQQPWSEDVATELKSQGVDTSSLIQKKSDGMYWVRRQSVQVSFENVETTKEAAMKMPLWTEKLIYNPSEKKISTKAEYSDYEMTQLF